MSAHLPPLPAPTSDDGLDTLVKERASATPGCAHHRHQPTSDTPHHVDTTARPLSKVQRTMLDAIMLDESAATAALPIFTPGPRMSARDRLGVYRDGYNARLVECLTDDYPILAGTLGSERFEALCHDYVSHHPSTSPSLNYFGRHMPEFCKTLPPQGNPSPIFISELAALEWALVEIIHAAQVPPLDVAALAQMPPEAWAHARLRASRAVRMLTFSYPINTYYQAYRTQDTPPALPSREPTATAVYRRGLQLWRMDLTPSMARVLSSLLAGEPIGEALGQIEVVESDVEGSLRAVQNVQIWFREWVSGGMFTHVDVGDKI